MKDDPAEEVRLRAYLADHMAAAAVRTRSGRCTVYDFDETSRSWTVNQSLSHDGGISLREMIENNPLPPGEQGCINTIIENAEERP